MFGTTLAQAQGRTDEEWRDAARRGEGGKRWVTFVADDAGALVGMATGAVIDDGAAELLQMWVDPNGRRSGVGTRLCEVVLRWAADRGAPVISLAVNGADPAAVALYRSVGFRDTRRREPDLFSGRDGLATIMERSAPARR